MSMKLGKTRKGKKKNFMAQTICPHFMLSNFWNEVWARRWVVQCSANHWQLAQRISFFGCGSCCMHDTPGQSLGVHNFESFAFRMLSGITEVMRLFFNRIPWDTQHKLQYLHYTLQASSYEDKSKSSSVPNVFISFDHSTDFCVKKVSMN